MLRAKSALITFRCTCAAYHNITYMSSIPKRNYDNIHKALKQIKDNPETWDQLSWHCGASHCFAGWGQIHAGCDINDDTAKEDAKIHFGFTEDEANYYFSSLRSLVEIAQALLPIDDAGYNRAGYDRAGYDCDGYNRDGYNRAGYNRAGYNRAGYNRAGYNRDGEDFILNLIDNYPNI